MDFPASLSTGAGNSGSGPPLGVSSIQRTTVPSEYVCTTLNSIDFVFVGSGPAEIVKSWNSPGAIAPPDHVSFDTASVIVPSSVLIGFASVVVSADHVHPGIGCTLTNAIGLSVGNVTSSFTVLAVLLSLGTEKLKTLKLPFLATSGLMVTWAPAGTAASEDHQRQRRPVAAATRPSRRRSRLGRGEGDIAILPLTDARHTPMDSSCRSSLRRAP